MSIAAHTLFFLLASAAPVVGGNDFLSAKLSIDAQIAPQLDEQRVRQEIDGLAKAAADMISDKADDAEKLRAVRKVIYVAGPWNNNRAFDYDMSDPLGHKVVNRLLSTYLKTRQGNCVSMPILFLILADRLGVKVGLVRAPNHLFVRTFGPEGQHINIETTSGGYPARDAYYRETSYITDAAIKNGVFLSDLTHEQTIEEMRDALVEALIQQKRYAEAINLANEMLEIDPRNALALVWRATIIDHLIQEGFEAKYSRPSLIPAALQSNYGSLVQRRNADIEAAHVLGWLDESEWPKQATGKP